jgi:hypothetical protein
VQASHTACVGREFKFTALMKRKIVDEFKGQMKKFREKKRSIGKMID